MTSATSQRTTAPTRPRWRDVYKIHPVADFFHLMSSSELKELADSISRLGLQSKVFAWLDESGQWWLLDGRNRLDAMEMTGCPETEWPMSQTPSF